jgi:hypothetical protein
MNLVKLRKKRAKRVKSRKRHYRRFTEHRAAGRNARAKWQLKRFRWDRNAVRKIDRLIAQERDRIRKERLIDWEGNEKLSFVPLLAAVRTALTVDGLYVTSTTGGTHSSTSYHYQAKAVDFGSSGPGETPEITAQRLLLDTYGASYFAELFGPDPWYVKNGVVYRGVFPAHGDHLHVAVI